MTVSTVGIKPHAAPARGITQPKEMDMVPCASCGSFTSEKDEVCGECLKKALPKPQEELRE